MSASIAVILFATAITPGPNNFVVMDVARRGLRAAIAPIAGVVLGTIALILALRFGLDVALLAHPATEHFMRLAGACLLGYLALRTLIAGWSTSAASAEVLPAHRTLFLTMLSLQFINPKTWVLASAVSATHAAQASAPILPLVVLAILVPTGCLFVWAAAGQMLGAFFRTRLVQRSVSLAFALTLAAFAILLLLSD